MANDKPHQVVTTPASARLIRGLEKHADAMRRRREAIQRVTIAMAALAEWLEQEAAAQLMVSDIRASELRGEPRTSHMDAWDAANARLLDARLRRELAEYALARATALELTACRNKRAPVSSLFAGAPPPS